MPVSAIGWNQKSDGIAQVSPDTFTARSGYPASLAVVLAAVERQMIEDALLRTSSCRMAAKELQISPRKLFYKMRCHGIRTAPWTGRTLQCEAER